MDEDAFRAFLASLDPRGVYLASAERSTVSQEPGTTAVGERAAKANGVEGSIVTGEINSLTHITTIYQGDRGPAQLDISAFQSALGRYLHWVEKHYGRLDLRGVVPREQNPLPLPVHGFVYLPVVMNVFTRVING